MAKESYMGRYRQRPIQVEPNSEKVCQSLAWHLPKKEHTHIFTACNPVRYPFVAFVTNPNGLQVQVHKCIQW